MILLFEEERLEQRTMKTFSSKIPLFSYKTFSFFSGWQGRKCIKQTINNNESSEKNAASECRMGNYFVFKAKITAEGLKKVR